MRSIPIFNMGKLIRVGPPHGNHKNWKRKNLSNPYGNLYRKISVSCPGTPLHGKGDTHILEVLETASLILDKAKGLGNQNDPSSLEEVREPLLDLVKSPDECANLEENSQQGEFILLCISV